MDFPDNATTNVHKINDISSVRWALYSLEVLNPSDSPDEVQTPDDASRLHDEIQQSSEYELRSRGYHVLYGAKKNELWVFDLPELITSSAYDSNVESIFRIINSSIAQYTKMTSGSLDASDLYSESAKTPSFSPSNINSAERTNAQAFGANSAFGNIHSFNDSDEPKTNLLHPSPQDFASILVKMIEAISLSISYFLAKNLSYSPVGSGSYITTLLPSASVDLIDDPSPDQFQLGSSLTSISIRWWPSGVLTISSSQIRLPELRQVLDPVNNFQGLELANPITVVLSPSGRTARYLGEYQIQTQIEKKKQETPHGSVLHRSSLFHDSINEAKNSITSRLTQLGLHISPKEVWLRLQYAENSLVYDSTENWQKMTLPPGTFIWPSSLCFCIVGDEYQQSMDSPKITIGSNNDPLADAELWFKAKSTREQAMDAASRQNHMKDKIKEEHPGVDEDDGISDFVPRTNQYISTQEANSIYPTPPDGLRTQTINSSNAENPPPSSEITNREAVGGQAHEDHGSPFMGSSDPIVSSAVYGPRDNTDLFDEIDGEMDSELFADNVLTEADFSFFDKPDVEDNINNSEDQAATWIDNGSLKIPLEHANLDAINDAAAGHLMDAVMREKKSTRGDTVVSERFKPDLKSDGDMIKNKISIMRQKQLPSSHDGQTVEKVPMVQVEDIVEAIEEDHKTSFRSISFREKLREFDVKYAKEGRFGYEPENDNRGHISQELTNLNSYAIPRIGMHFDRSSGTSREDGTTSDLELDSSEDEPDSYISEPLSKHELTQAIEEPNIATSRKRKRDQGETKEYSTTPSFSDHSNRSETEKFDGSTPHFNPSMFKPTTYLLSNSTLPILLRNLHPEFSKYVGGDQGFIQIAQILIEQLVLHTEFTNEVTPLSLDHSLWNSPPLHEYSPQQLISRLFPRSEPCSLKNYFSIEKGVSESAIREIIVGRPSHRDQSLPSKAKPFLKAQPNMIKLPAPFTCIRRNQAAMDILAPALYFWEELGLGPSHGEKDIHAICICPAIDSARQGAGIFLNMVGSAYQSCKLGSHNLAPDTIGCCDGIMPVPIEDGSFVNVMDQLNQICERLGTNIGQLNIEGGNTVIYMINPFMTPQAIPHLCSAFLKIFETYAFTLKTQQVMNPNDLVLQIIPLELVSSQKTIVLPSPLAYRRLAFEVYDRCPPNISSSAYRDSQFVCAPSIQLARTMPKMINLKLSPEPTASLLQSDMCFHLAYAWDPTQEWLTASWTDNQGDMQWNTPYCLGVGEVDECWPMLLNIIKEIWETTLEMLYPKNSSWRLYIAKDSPMHKRELEAWLLICTQPSLPSITCTFLTIDSNPPIQFPPPLPLEKLSIPLPNTYYTPGSTPAAHTVSPDTSGLVSTPGGNPPNTPTPTSGLADFDTDAKLIDITDESWSLVFHFPSSDPLLPSSLCPSIASGYLLKRAGARDEDGLIAMGVDIIHGDLKGRESVLREVLSMYRGLAALARLRGIVDRVKGVLPWHVAAARKAGDGVNSLMSWNWDGE